MNLFQEENHMCVCDFVQLATLQVREQMWWPMGSCVHTNDMYRHLYDGEVERNHLSLRILNGNS